jgi:flagellar biosynthesis protein FliP
MCKGTNFSPTGRRCSLRALLAMFLFLLPGLAIAADITLPGISVQFGNNASGNAEVATAVKILLALTILSLAPAILIVTTSFTRIIVVLSMLRHAFGMQQTPPNTVLISLALFLTIFSMMPSLRAIQAEAFQPFMDGKITSAEAMDKGLFQMRDFMVRQTREQDLALMVEVSGSEQPRTMEDINTLLLIPAFMLSELKSAFQIGFVIFLPFLLIDIVVASILMSMGMLMVPPMMISLPIKILMFVLIDGWNLVVQSLMYSFA